MQETHETWVQSLGQKDPLQQETATCSSILGQKIPWTEEPSGYSSRGYEELDTAEYAVTRVENMTSSFILTAIQYSNLGFPGGSDRKESSCNAGDMGLIPGLGRSLEGGHGNPLQYSCLENPQGQRSLVGYSPWGRKESDTTERLSIHSTFKFNFQRNLVLEMVKDKYFTQFYEAMINSDLILLTQKFHAFSFLPQNS